MCEKTRKISRKIMGFCMLLFAVFTLSITANAGDGAEEIVQPDGQGVTNPAASIELVDVTDGNFYIYSYDGEKEPVFPSGYAFYDTMHTVYVRLIGENPEEVCDDVAAFFSGNECDIKTDSQGIADEEQGLWQCTVTLGGHDGPAPYTVITSSGATLSFMTRALTVPSKITLNFSSYNLSKGRIIKLTHSSVPDDGTCVWSSSDETVATVSQAGVVTGISDGIADITFTYEGYGLTLTNSCKVKVGTGTNISETNSGANGAGTNAGASGTSTKAAVKLSKGSRCTAGSGKSKALYEVINTSKKTVAYVRCLSAKKQAVVPKTVTLSDGQTYIVTQISAKAFSTSKKVTTVNIKTGKLTKKGVKKSLKGSKVKTIKTAYAASYKKFFTKKNCGKAVKVKK